MNVAIQTKPEILKVLGDHTAQLKALGVLQVGLFGSLVRGDQKAESDVDLLVQFDPKKKTFDNFMQLSEMLEGIFKRHVEIVTTEALSPYIGPHILREVEYATLSA